MGKQGHQLDEDEYIDEDIEESEKFSILTFVPPTISEKGWSFTFDLGEIIELFTMTEMFIAAWTSNERIRLLTPEGVEFMVLSGFQNVVTLASFENLLAVFYHGSNPLSNGQSIRIKLVDVATMEVQMDCTTPISDGNELKWAGFSNKGLIYI